MDWFIQIKESLLFEEISCAKCGGEMASYGMVPQRKEI